MWVSALDVMSANGIHLRVAFIRRGLSQCHQLCDRTNKVSRTGQISSGREQFLQAAGVSAGTPNTLETTLHATCAQASQDAHYGHNTSIRSVFADRGAPTFKGPLTSLGMRHSLVPVRIFLRSHASPCPSESMHTHHPAAVRAHSSSGTLIHACMLLKLRNVP